MTYYWWTIHGLLMKQRGVTLKIGNRVVSGHVTPAWWWPLNWLGVPMLLIVDWVERKTATKPAEREDG